MNSLLVARSLARHIAADGWKRWSPCIDAWAARPARTAVLVELARQFVSDGLPDHADRLLALLADQAHDGPLRPRLAVAAACAAALPPGTWGRDAVALEAFQVWWDFALANRADSVAHLYAALRAVAQVNPPVGGERLVALVWRLVFDRATLPCARQALLGMRWPQALLLWGENAGGAAGSVNRGK